MKLELKNLLGRRIAPLLIVAGAVGLVLIQTGNSRAVDLICNLSGLERPPERLLVLALRNGQPLRRIEIDLTADGVVNADGRATVSFELTEGPVQLTLRTENSGEAPETRAVGLLEIGGGRNVVMADLRRGKMNLVLAPE